MSEWDAVQQELNSAVAGYYKPKALAVGGSETIVIERYTKQLETKFPIKDKAGNSLGYTWRFWLRDGRVWDVSNANRRVIMSGLHPEGKAPLVPGRFKVTNVGQFTTKTPSVKVEYLGPAGARSEADDEPVF